MKKIFTIAILAAGMLFAGKANAQLGVHLGYAPDAWANENASTTITSFYGGVDYNMPVKGDLNVNIGAQLRFGTESGSSNVGTIVAGQHTTNLLSLEVPVLFNYGFNLSGDLGLAIFAGPKIGFYVSGTTKYEGNVLGLISGSTETQWFNDETGSLNYNPLNISATFGLALTFKQFRLFGGYNYGFFDMDNNDNLQTTIRGPFVGLGMEL